MATTYTTKAKLRKPAKNDGSWNVPLNSNADVIDGMNPATALMATLNEIPSTSRTIAVAPGVYIKGDGTLGTYAGGTLTLTASTTRYVYLDSSYTLTSATGWPGGLHTPIAVVVVGTTTITSITDSRPLFGVVGATFGGGGSGGIAGLKASTAEDPSSSLNLAVAAGKYQKADGTAGTYAGGTIAITASTTRKVYLDGNASYALASAAAYPGTPHVPIASVVAGATTITSIADDRLSLVASGATGTALPVSGGTMAEGGNIAVGTTTGTKIGTATTQKLGFWNATPIVRPAAYSQGYTTATRSVAGYTTAAVGSNFTGITNAQAGSPYATVSDLNSLRASYENLRLSHDNLLQVVTALIDDHQALGFCG